MYYLTLKDKEKYLSSGFLTVPFLPDNFVAEKVKLDYYNRLNKGKDANIIDSLIEKVDKLFIGGAMRFTFLKSSCGVYSLPERNQVSGLWQYRHLIGHPWKKTTNLIPGPSTVPNDSVE